VGRGSGAEPWRKTNLVHAKRHRTLLLAIIIVNHENSVLQNCRIIIFNSPNFSKKNVFPYFFLEHLLPGLYGADAPATTTTTRATTITTTVLRVASPTCKKRGLSSLSGLFSFAFVSFPLPPLPFLPFPFALFFFLASPCLGYLGAAAKCCELRLWKKVIRKSNKRARRCRLTETPRVVRSSRLGNLGERHILPNLGLGQSSSRN